MSDTRIATSRLLPATPQDIFDAFADAARLARWWGPEGFRNTFHHFDFQPLGEWRFTMHGPDGTDYPNHSRFEHLAPDRIVLRHLNAPNFLLTVTLQDAQGGTRVGWTMDFDDPAVAAAVRPICVPANEQNLDRLTQVLAATR